MLETADKAEGLIDRDNTASSVWADTAYRSRTNNAFLAKIGKVSRIHHKKPQSRPMPKRTARSNAQKSAVRARIEHVFAKLQECACRTVPVLADGRLAGIVTLDNVGEFLSIRAAMRK